MARKTSSAPRLREKSLGRYGEDVAARYLQESGLVLIDRNWRGPSGELDLIALDGGVLVVCEVKTRTSDAFGGPLAAVDRRKLARLRVLAAQWLAEHPIGVDGMRIDVVGVWRNPRGPAKLQHIVGVQ
ncbi:MAG: YraN family protein [Candidatus Nanopelagicales bacterium]